MRFDFHYRRENVVDVDAAVVGVSRLRWVSLAPDEANDLDRARQIMSERQFDLMPVDVAGEEVTAYVKSRVWGRFEEGVERHEITPEDVIPQRTPLEEVIRGFALHDRDFYFLSSYGRITGLITIVNLNCRQARVFLYGLLNELEVAFGRVVQDKIDDGRLTIDDVLADVAPSVRTAYDDCRLMVDDSPGDVDHSIRAAYDHDREHGVDSNVVEYLYLPNLIKVIRKRGLYSALGYDSGGAFEKPFNRLVKLRNKVAHPVRSLVDAPDAAKKLWRDVRVIEQALSRLRSLSLMTP